LNAQDPNAIEYNDVRVYWARHFGSAGGCIVHSGIITGMICGYMYLGFGRLLIIGACLICFGFLALVVIIPVAPRFVKTDVRTEFFAARSAVTCIYFGLAIIALIALAASIQNILKAW
jgi:hypothetical protein